MTEFQPGQMALISNDATWGRDGDDTILSRARGKVVRIEEFSSPEGQKPCYSVKNGGHGFFVPADALKGVRVAPRETSRHILTTKIAAILNAECVALRSKNSLESFVVKVAGVDEQNVYGVAEGDTECLRYQMKHWQVWARPKGIQLPDSDGIYIFASEAGSAIPKYLLRREFSKWSASGPGLEAVVDFKNWIIVFANGQDLVRMWPKEEEDF